ncbi:hypothetical protein N8J89_03800 [Crossiella sp. CA-258035]|uniref:hypothetical protein n=1 Tax=Crossiella sp. CA-258035 TaxID=2981138 RepID=UPI0024BBF86F|nr:hypothetical protein [Crossiella sp. CA-258035]WHT20208.1 hypothetical protein N8J89_03800 [Crossiella sp. CA-258035]
MPATSVDQCVTCTQSTPLEATQQPESCAPCLTPLDTECEDCHTLTDDTAETDDHKTVCLDCAEYEYYLCDHCGLYAKSSHDTDFGEAYCIECVNKYLHECDLCERFTRDSEEANDGNFVCQVCADQEYRRCSYCLNLNPYGESCDCEGANSSDFVYDYSYKPRPVFHGDGPRFLGLELETSTKFADFEECAEVAATSLGDLGYLKEDSSIDSGFEIVTHPMSYAWALDHFPWHLLARLSAHGCKATYDTGIHVHISRKAFRSPGHIYRWMKFLHRNAEQVTSLARRVSNQWASFDADGRSHVKDYAKGGCGDRYQAINANPRETFELRIFASSLRPREVQAALGLADASVQYASELTIADIAQKGGWDWSAFASWLDQHPEYAALKEEMEIQQCAS